MKRIKILLIFMFLLFNFSNLNASEGEISKDIIKSINNKNLKIKNNELEVKAIIKENISKSNLNDLDKLNKSTDKNITVKSPNPFYEYFYPDDYDVSLVDSYVIDGFEILAFAKLFKSDLAKYEYVFLVEWYISTLDGQYYLDFNFEEELWYFNYNILNEVELKNTQTYFYYLDSSFCNLSTLYRYPANNCKGNYEEIIFDDYDTNTNITTTYLDNQIYTEYDDYNLMTTTKNGFLVNSHEVGRIGEVGEITYSIFDTYYANTNKLNKKVKSIPYGFVTDPNKLEELESKETWLYNTDGSINYKTLDTYFDNSYQVKSSTKLIPYTYTTNADNLGKLSSKQEWAYKENGAIDYSIKDTYFSNSIVVSKSVKSIPYAYTNNQENLGKLKSMQTWSYNSKGNILNTVTDTYYKNSYTIQQRTKSTPATNSLSKLKSKEIFSFNKKGQLKSNSSGKAYYYKTTYKNGKATSTYKYTYSKTGKLTNKTKVKIIK